MYRKLRDRGVIFGRLSSQKYQVPKGEDIRYKKKSTKDTYSFDSIYEIILDILLYVHLILSYLASFLFIQLLPNFSCSLNSTYLNNVWLISIS